MPGVGAPAPESSADRHRRLGRRGRRRDRCDSGARRARRPQRRGQRRVGRRRRAPRARRARRVRRHGPARRRRGISEFEIVDGVDPVPGLGLFDEPEIADLDERTRAEAAARTASVPAKVPTDPLSLRDERRHQVPVTLLTGRCRPKRVRGMHRAVGAAGQTSSPPSRTPRSSSSAPGTGRSSRSPSPGETSRRSRLIRRQAGRRRSGPGRSQWPMPRPPSTGMTAPEM